jgi:uncharacterized protein YbaR (Trm112 family)
MISPEFVASLRCPLDPGNTGLDLTATGLVCKRCKLTFPIRDDIPNMLAEEAQLPSGCASLDQLPCRQGK